MPSREKRARRREQRFHVLPMLIGLLTLVAAVLVVILLRSDPLKGPQEAQLPFDYIGSLNFTDSNGATAQPLVLGASPAVSPSATPESAATPQPSPTAQPEETPAEGEQAAQEDAQAEGDSVRLIPTPAPGDYFLPVFDKALRTPDDEMMIAITVDDCNDPQVMTQILSIARHYGAKLTLFPTGEALMTSGMTEGFATCVKDLGYELENHSYAHKAEYKLSSAELALQLWRQSVAASYAVGADYQQHFYRPYNKNSAGDQRTHFFIRKLGYTGIASYTYSYKGYDLQSLVGTLENGNVYQFDMSEESMALFEGFISEASRKGYKLVTMNRLFGLEENEISSQLTLDQQTLPTMEDYVPTYYNLKLNDRTNAVFALQTRLMELGYLNGEEVKADGIYGADTSTAVSVFQAKVGIIATGNADVATQEKLFAQDAPPAE